jgi:phage shock protein B
MHGVMVVAIVFGGAVLILAIIGSTILMGIKIMKGGVSRKDQEFQTEETEMIQQIYQGLSRLEERVEALETIIIDRDRKDRGS